MDVMSVLFQNDFDRAVLNEISHRPFPMPDTPWFMTQTWHDVLFLHWPVDARELGALLPAGLELDLFDGQAYVAVTPFHMSNLAARGMPALPGMSAMPELNVRTYVHRKGTPGIYFLSLDTSSALAVGAARSMFHLPYHAAQMTVDERQGWIHYESTRSTADGVPATFRGRYRGVGAPRRAERGSLEYFLTERYCLFCVDDAFQMHRVDIHHGPWNLTLAEADIDVNTMADAAGLRLPSMTPLAHYAARQDTVVWPLTRADD